MAHFFSICTGCGKRRFVIKKRNYAHPQVQGKITSQSELCRPCYKRINKMINP